MRTRTRQITAALKRKFGPLPAYAWLAILGVAVYLYRSRRGNPIAASVANTGTDTGTTDTGNGQGQPPTVLGPGEAAYDSGTGKLYGNDPEQQPGQTPDPQAPTILDPGQTAYDSNTGKTYTAPGGKSPAAGGSNGKTSSGKQPSGKGRSKTGKTKRSAAQMRKDNPGMVKRVKDRVLKSKKRHNVTTPAKPGQTTRPNTGGSKPRAGGAVKNQGNRSPGSTHPAKPATAPKNRGLSHSAATPANPRATVTTKVPVAVKSAPMVQRPAAPVSAPKAKPAPKPAPRKRK